MAAGRRVGGKATRRSAVVVLCLLGLGLSLANSSAQTWRTVCTDEGAGQASTDGRWVVLPPFRIQMSHRTGVSVARRVDRDGFVEAPRDVPCDVADGVAGAAVSAWPRWTDDDGTVAVSFGVVGPTYLGRFRCTAMSAKSRGAIETCTHTRDQHVGRISVKFTITTWNPTTMIACGQHGAAGASRRLQPSAAGLAGVLCSSANLAHEEHR